MLVLLLAGYRNSLGENVALAKKDGQLLLDRQIQFWRANKIEIAVVLSGQEADDALRVSKYLPQCDLVFDTHEDACAFTNLQSGLYLPQNDCWAMTLDAATPDFADLQRWTAQSFPLRNKAHIFQSEAEWPVFIPKPAHKHISQLKGIRSLTDPQIILSKPQAYCPVVEIQKLYKPA